MGREGRVSTEVWASDQNSLYSQNHHQKKGLAESDGLAAHIWQFCLLTIKLNDYSVFFTFLSRKEN
jgi:hypothetical protein